MDERETQRYAPRAAYRLDGARSAVLTLSDRASEGQYEDRSGPILVAGLQALGADVVASEVLPDGIEPLAAQVRALADAGVHLCLCTGGTGLGPRDLSPEALQSLGGRPVTGLAQMLRALSAREQEYSVEFGDQVINEVQMELFCEDSDVGRAVEIFRQIGRTGRAEAGWIYVSTIDQSIPINDVR